MSSFTIAWPAGTLTGDLAILFVAAGYGASAVPTGWTALYHRTSDTNINGLVAYKILTSADITAGSVAVSLLGSSPGGAAIVTFIRTPSVLECDVDQRVSVITDAVSTSGSVPAGSLALYFGAGLANGFKPQVTVNRGTLVQSHSDTDFCTCLYSETVPAGALTATFGFSVTASILDAIVIIGPPPIVGPQASPSTLMTSDTAPAPYVTTASSEVPIPGQGTITSGDAFNAFSQMYETDSEISWQGEFADPLIPGLLNIDLGSAKIIGGYAIKMATGFPLAKTPQAWMLQGSPDSSDGSWINVDAESGVTDWTTGVAGLRSFLVSAPPVGFRYWRIWITLNNGDPGFVGVGSLLLYEWSGQ